MTAPVVPAGYRLTALDSVDSTNEEAKRQARAGAPDGTLVWARMQTAGRGRSGHGWQSPAGNLYLSMVVRLASAAQAAELSFVAAVALGEALDAFWPSGAPVRFKWPNDVLLDGRKVAGLLVEAESAGGRTDWAVLGAGVNVAWAPEGTEWPATSLQAEGVAATVESVLGRFVGRLAAWRRRSISQGFAPVAAAWKSRARGIGEPIRVRLPRETLQGTFVDLDADGALLLDLRDGSAPRRITAGDVFFA
jgi:BirA family biotin operon repressor/biotin-[acetyl-CoA-carboxylase] ligase